MRLAVAPLVLLVCASCSTVQQDEPSESGVSGLTLQQIQTPGAPNYHPCPSTNTTCDTQTITNTVVTWLDKFDETRDGKSAGTLYIRDVGANHVFGGIGIYEPNFVPASLDPLPGDVLDFAGPYQEANSIGTAVFNPGTFLPQLYKPVGTFRYEFASDFPPAWSAPQQIQIGDLNEAGPTSAKPDGNFAHARQYLQMVVTVNDVYVSKGTSAPGGQGFRVTYPLGTCGNTTSRTCFSSLNPPQISNELFDLQATDYAPGTHFTSVTGIVTWFYSFHIAPRTRDDLVLAPGGDAGTE